MFMKPLKITLALAVVAGLGVSAALSEKPTTTANRAALKKQLEAGNFKDAYEGFRQLALDPADDPRKVGDDLTQAATALQQLGRIDELDDLREAVIRTHAKNWRLLWSAAETYLAFDNYGFIIAGKFYRGQHRGGGQAVNSFERDRVRALQLMVQAMPLAAADRAHDDVASFYLDIARLLLANRGYDEAWRLQTLTAIGELPDYAEGWYYGHTPAVRRSMPRAIRFTIACQNRSTRRPTTASAWRWSLAQAVEFAPGRKNEVRWQLADFLSNQFGVQTMAYYGRFFFGQDEDDDAKKNESGTYSTANLGRRRNDRPPGQRHQAIGTCGPSSISSSSTHRSPPSPRRVTAIRPSNSWPKSTKTGGSIPKPPITGVRPSSNTARATRSRLRI